jgi:nucleoside triphosphatase
MQKEEKKYPEPIVGALIVNKDGEILLGGGKKYKGKWTIPGGHIETGETLEEAVKREVKEETGLDIEIIAKIGFSDSVFSDEFHREVHFVFCDFLCRYDGDSKKIKDHKEFDGGFQWIEVNEALKLDLFHGARKIIKEYSEYLTNHNTLDSWKRCQADFENYKKEQAKHQEEFLLYAKIGVIEQIFPVLDNFEASLVHVPEKSKENKWVEGVVYIKKQIEDVLKNNNIEEIEVEVGDKFNPEIHEAIGGEGKKQVIKKILQKGYRLNERVVRAARVEVE